MAGAQARVGRTGTFATCVASAAVTAAFGSLGPDELRRARDASQLKRSAPRAIKPSECYGSAPHIEPQEQITDGPAHPVGQPSLRQMMRPVMDQVAALAEALQVGRVAVRRVMVEMRGSEDDAGDAYSVKINAPWRRALVAVAIAPAGVAAVEPPPVRQAHHLGAVAAAADFAAALGAPEPDLPAQLRPVDRIEPAERCAYRHIRSRVEQSWNNAKKTLKRRIGDQPSAERRKPRP